jgi:hypothetical protein
MKRTILTSLATAGLFEALTLVATQDKTVRAASPWQDDPYDAVVSLAVFTVPMLALAIAQRLPAWRAPGGPDRVQQLTRAAGVMIALVGLTAGFEWASVIGRVHASAWDTRTAVLIAGLVAVTALTVALAVPLVRGLGSPAGWRHDWLGDVVLVWGKPLRVATPQAADWVRRHALAVFAALSLIAGAGMAGSLAVGESWTDPVLIGWAVAVLTTSYLAFCVISNALAGFIARPPRTPRRRAAETSVVAGGVGIQVAVAFRDVLWRALGLDGSLTSVPALVALTFGAGLLTAVVTAGLLARKGST